MKKYCLLNPRVLFLFVLLSGLSLSNAQEFAKKVDTRIGSVGNGLGCGFNYIGASYPFGMVQFTPSFFSPHKGFVINQLNGAGCPHMGNFPVLPLAGNIQESPDDMTDFPKYISVNEASAGYLSLNMNDNTIAELTVTKRTGVARFLFDDKAEEGTILIGSGVNSTFVRNARVEITSDHSCEGFAEGGEFCGAETKYRVYFVAEFDRPAKASGTWMRGALLKDVDYAYGENSGAYFCFDTERDKEVQYRIAISYVSVENARENLKSENTELSFDASLGQARDAWNDKLGRILVSSENEDREKQFYTHFYHALIHPNIVSDVNGEYMGSDYECHRVEQGNYYSSFSVWDTYRTQAQLLAMLFPDEVSEMMQSLVDFADRSGGYGRWILANVETGIMQGDPTSILIANSYAFGAQSFNLERAYYHMKRGATIPYLRSQEHEIRPYLSEYMKYGSTFASMMLEYTSADFAIGQFAFHAVEEKEDAGYFIHRAQQWKNIFNPELNWLCSRYPSGKWKDINDDWREATYKNYFWMVPYNLKDLIDTIGGKKMAEKRLDVLFKRLDASYDDDWFAAGNEPDFHVPWVYNWTNAPNKTSMTVHRVLTDIYNSSPSGLPGNDDLGAMGAWYVFASIGLYPVVPGVGGFSVNTPQFEEISVTLPQGMLNISGGSTESIYIKALKVNKKLYSSSWIDWSEIKNGADIEFHTTNNKKKTWKVATAPPDFSHNFAK